MKTTIMVDFGVIVAWHEVVTQGGGRKEEGIEPSDTKLGRGGIRVRGGPMTNKTEARASRARE